MENRVVVVHEDRESHLTGLVLALNSIIKNNPGVKLLASHSSPSEEFNSWLLSNNIDSLSIQDEAFTGWNIKAKVIQHLLSLGYKEVIWVDADIIVVNNFLDSFSQFPATTIIATEETYWGQMQGGWVRTEHWGLKPSRELSRTINTGVLRVTSEHRMLIDKWCAMLAHPLYKKAQAEPWYQRPIHMVGDQEVFTALVASTEADEFELYQLKSGFEIAQCFGPAGFTLSERVVSSSNRQSLLFVHAMGNKPWLKNELMANTNKSKIRQYYDFIHLETCPYTLEAKFYTPTFISSDWCLPTNCLARAMRYAVRNSARFAELPLVLIDTATRYFKRIFKVSRYQANPEYIITDPYKSTSLS